MFKFIDNYPNGDNGGGRYYPLWRDYLTFPYPYERVMRQIEQLEQSSIQVESMTVTLLSRLPPRKFSLNLLVVNMWIRAYIKLSGAL